MKRHSVCLVSVWAVFLFFGLTHGLFAQDAQECNNRAKLAIRSGNHAEAKELLLRAMKLEPTWAEPYYNAAQLLRLLNKRDDMRRALKKAYDLEPSNSQYQDAFAKMLQEDLAAARQGGNAAEVKKLREEILRVNPRELKIGLEMVQELIKGGNIDGALKLALDLLDKNKKEIPEYRSPEIGELYFLLGKNEFERNQVLKAREYADRATRYPMEKPERAKELLANVKRLQKEGAEGHLKLGKSYIAKGQKEEGMAEFTKGLELDPDNEPIKQEIETVRNQSEARAVFAMALQQVSAQKWLEARDLLEQVLEIDPTHSEARKHLEQAAAVENELMKKLGRAERLPRTSQERADLTEGLIKMGQQFSRGKNFKEARVAFDRALGIIALDAKLEKFRPDIDREIAEMDAVDHLRQTWDKGVEARNSGDYEECIKLLEQLPTDYNVQLYSFLAESYWRTGNNEKAKTLANLQLSKQAENNRAKFILGNIYFEEGDKASAYKILKEVYDDDPEYPGLQDVYLKTTTTHWLPLVLPIGIILLLLWIAWLVYKNLPEYNKNNAIKRARQFLNKGFYKECIDELNAVKRLPILTPYDGAVISRLMGQAFLKTAAYLGRRMLSPESLPELLNLYKSEGNNVALVSLLGQHYASHKNLTAEGIGILEKWNELEPNNPEVLKPLGRFYLQKNRTDETAMRTFKAMMDSGQPEPDFLLGVAKMHIRLKQYQEALQLCERVLSLDVNNELVHSVLRDAYQKMDNLPELIEIYRSFLTENPYNVAFQNGLKEAQKALDRAGGARTPGGGAPAPTGEDLGEDAILCPHCQSPNTKADYYCQSCGKSIA
jgi:tetratricopeptide (TPR) repeat protein